jgi:hypothetical protein
MKGDKGRDGVKGVKGVKGVSGMPGWGGAPGDFGEHGDQGDKGNAGDNGLNGATGTGGFQGVNGDKGNKGFKGVASNGADGAKGSLGEAGAGGLMGDVGAPGEDGICIVTPEWTAYIVELTAWFDHGHLLSSLMNFRISKWNDYTANGLTACQSAEFSVDEVNTFLNTFDAWIQLTMDNLDTSFQATYDARITAYNTAVSNFQTSTDLKYTTILAQIADIKAQIDAVCNN